MTYADAYEKCRAIIGKSCTSWYMSITTWHDGSPRWGVMMLGQDSFPAFASPEEMVDHLLTRMQGAERSTGLDPVGDCVISPTAPVVDPDWAAA